jgi:predicted RND superfamily exporter protein
VQASLTGDLVTGLSEYGAIRTDLVSVGAIGISLVLGVILLYFVRLRSLVALGCAILAGTAWTFALTRLTIGHLNVATGFLFSIVAGNGINCGIIYFGRYLEERRLGSDVVAAIRTAHRETWVPTLTAALAATAAYGSLATSDFRGLKHFALIGGAGILLCWVATYTLLGPVVVLIDRGTHYARGRTFWSRLRYDGVRYDAPFSFLLRGVPRTILLVGLGLSFVGSAFGVSYFRRDPIEYDMKRLFNQMGGTTDLKRLSTLAREIVGVDAESSMSIVTDDVGQVPRLARALEAKRDAAPAGQKPFEAVHTLFDFVPDRQGEKIPLLLEMRGLLVRARGRGAIADADWSKIEPFLPPASIAQFGLDDLPKAIVRPFTERDGTRGRLVHIEPTHGEDEDDAHYLIRWADSFRETRLSENETIRGSGRVVLFADMLRAVLSDVPRTTVLSLALTVAMVIAAAGFTWEAFAVLGSLLVGVSWLFVLMVLFRIKLHFLNFVALPITFGIGVDYAINIARRYRDEPGLSPLDVLRRTGGAVILCSLTTMLGYLALVGSKNQAVHGLGVLAVLGEICCLLSAVLVLPAALLVFGEKRSFRTGQEPAP